MAGRQLLLSANSSQNELAHSIEQAGWGVRRGLHSVSEWTPINIHY